MIFHLLIHIIFYYTGLSGLCNNIGTLHNCFMSKCYLDGILRDNILIYHEMFD